MLIGELPGVQETQLGKDLIQIGKSEGRTEGKIEGKIESLLLLLNARFGPLGVELQQQVESLDSSEKLDRLVLQAARVDSLDELEW